jgi:hypothetical protein
MLKGLITQTEWNDLWKLDTVLTGRYFWKRPDEERLWRVDPELPTVYGGQVNLVKTGTGDPKELPETSV